jgi:hypothetical protein
MNEREICTFCWAGIKKPLERDADVSAAAEIVARKPAMPADEEINVWELGRIDARIVSNRFSRNFVVYDS